MRSFVLACVVFLLGTWFGFYQAHAASGMKYTGYLQGKDTAKASAAFLNGYAAGVFDELSQTAYIANEQSKYFTAEIFTKQYQCLQKIPNLGEAVAWAKDYWNKEPDVWAADQMFIHACEYNATSRANSTVKGGGPGPRAAGSHSITLTK